MIVVVSSRSGLVRIVSVLGLEKADSPGQGDAHEQRCRELKPIVCMKCYFRKQIGQGDAKKDTSSERQSTAQDEMLFAE